MARAPYAAVAPVDLAGVFLGVGDEFLHVLPRPVREREEHRLPVVDLGDGREIAQRVEGHLARLRHELVEAVVGEEQGVAVRLGLGDEAGALHARAAGHELHDHGLAEDVGDDARDATRVEVVAAARAHGQDERDGTIRIGRRARGGHAQRDDEAQRGQNDEEAFFHDGLL